MTDLFPDLQVHERPAGAPKGPQPIRPRLVEATDCWTVEDHVCRHCLGRILSRPGAAGRVYLCAMCGHEDASGVLPRLGGRQHPQFCACSMKFGHKDAGVRCEVNEAPSPDLPQQIVARQVA